MSARGVPSPSRPPAEAGQSTETDEPQTEVTSVAPDQIPPNEDAAAVVAVVPVVDSRKPGRPRKDPNAPKPFRPKVLSLTVSAHRRVGTGQYEHLDVESSLTAVPDPNFSIRENFTNCNALVVHEVGVIAEQVQREIALSKG
jgi:hypothetical protein